MAKGSGPSLTRGRKIVGKNREDIRVFEVKAGGCQHFGYVYSIPGGGRIARGLGQFHGVIATATSKNSSPEVLQLEAMGKLQKKLKAACANWPSGESM